MKSFVTIIILSIVSILPTHAQSLSWMHYNQNNSPLPSNSITTILSTENGTWVGSTEGLAFYDGSDWTVYTHETSELPNNYVQDIHEDDWGNTWIATDAGIVRINEDGWQVFNQANSDLPSNTTRSVTTDSEGNLWVGTWGYGIANLNGNDWTIYNTTNSELPSNGIFTVELNDNGDVWVGTYNGGVSIFREHTWTNYNTSNSQLPNNNVRSITFDDQQTVWLGTDDGLAKFSGGAWQAYTYQNIGFSVHTFYDGIKQSSGDVFFGTDGGIVHFNQSEFEVITAQNSDLVSNNIRCITQDENGDIWVGTGNDGISIYSPLGTLSVEDDNALETEIYPNPTANKLNLRLANSANGPVLIEIRNATGQLVESQSLTTSGQTHHVNVTHLPTGVYHLTLKSANSLSAKMFCKL